MPTAVAGCDRMVNFKPNWGLVGDTWTRANASGHFESCDASGGLRQRWRGQRSG